LNLLIFQEITFWLLTNPHKVK